MNSPYPRPRSQEPRYATRFNRMDGLMLAMILTLAGVLLLLILAARLDF